MKQSVPRIAEKDVASGEKQAVAIQRETDGGIPSSVSGENRAGSNPASWPGADLGNGAGDGAQRAGFDGGAGGGDNEKDHSVATSGESGEKPETLATRGQTADVVDLAAERGKRQSSQQHSLATRGQKSLRKNQPRVVKSKPYIEPVKASKGTWAFRLRWRENGRRVKPIYVSRVSDIVYDLIRGGDYEAFKQQLIASHNASAIRASHRA